MQAFARLLLLLSASVLAVASSSSSSNGPPANFGGTPGTAPAPQAPASQPMDPSVAHGLWKSNFGAVKLVPNLSAGSDVLEGVWLYQREGQEVIGYFSGKANGNVLKFSWEEPSTGSPLRGTGYLVFDPQGQSFTGSWWTTNRDRGGDWNGWREQAAAAETAPVPGY